MSGAHLILGASASTSSFGFARLLRGAMMMWESERKVSRPQGRLCYLIIKFNILTLSSNCGTKLRTELGCKKAQLATSTLTQTSEIGSWGHEVEALSYRS